MTSFMREMELARPEITAELLSESSGSVSIGQAEVFGARFDIRFSEPCQAGGEVAVEFKAESSA